MSRNARQVAENLQSVRDRIAAAAARSGRSAEDVKLVAVSKYAELDWVRILLDLGERDLGENYPQQLLDRSTQFDASVRWHLIGSLQRNKARKVLPVVSMIHSVDSLKLAATLDRLAGELGLQREVLLEVNVSQEASKHGFTVDELRQDWEQFANFQSLRVCGLMTMAPQTDNPEQARPVFAALHGLRDELNARSTAVPLRHLSMGMTGDFEVAIEEGATLVRIGSALWEGLSSTNG